MNIKSTLVMWLASRMKSLFAVTRKISRIVLCIIVFLFTAYFVSYVVLIFGGERRARLANDSGYELIFVDDSKNHAEFGACLLYWPIYQYDYVFADSSVRPRWMPGKEMSYRKYCVLWRIYLTGE